VRWSFRRSSAAPPPVFAVRRRAARPRRMRAARQVALYAVAIVLGLWMLTGVVQVLDRTEPHRTAGERHYYENLEMLGLRTGGTARLTSRGKPGARWAPGGLSLAVGCPAADRRPHRPSGLLRALLSSAHAAPGDCDAGGHFVGGPGSRRARATIRRWSTGT
jgi:hypothetical protein